MPLLLYVLSVLAVLWFIDMFQTIALTREYGVKAEGNPFARFLLKHNNADFIAFKIMDLAILGTIVFFINEKHILLANSLLALFVIFYLLTITHNHRIIVKETGATSFVELYLRREKKRKKN